jgi:hypothetical protein
MPHIHEKIDFIADEAKFGLNEAVKFYAKKALRIAQ